MNIRAKCVNEKCASFGTEKSVFVGQLMGFGASNDRVKCPSCGELMKATESINTSKTRRAPARDTSRRSGRGMGGGRSATRKKKRKPHRSTGRRISR